MSNKAVVIDTLVKKREQLILERDKMYQQFSEQISEIEAALETYGGKKVWEIGSNALYDDENPEYIKQSIEEI